MEQPRVSFPFPPLSSPLSLELVALIPRDLKRADSLLAFSVDVLSTNWSPFDDSVVASGGEDGKVLIWKVQAADFEGWSDDGFVAKDWEPEEKMSAGGRLVCSYTLLLVWFDARWWEARGGGRRTR